MASLIVLLAIGCASGPVNPSFNLTPPAAREAIAQMRSKPVQLQRPLVIIGGFSDFGIGPAIMRSKLAAMVGGDHRIVTVSVPFAATFDDCRHDVIAAVDRAFLTTRPSTDDSTTEVDVIGLSMGGLVARYSAMPPSGRRLRIARLFTVSSPLAGAKLAAVPSLDRKVRDMRAGSPMLLRLADEDAFASYELIPYVRLDDEIVGEANAAPPGQTAWWVPNLPLESSHIGAGLDPRLLADIARRLRGETPFTTAPPAPLPRHR